MAALFYLWLAGENLGPLVQRRDISPAGVFYKQDAKPKQRGGQAPREHVMQLHTHLMKSIFGKAVLAAVALGGFLFFKGTPSAPAQEVVVVRRPVFVERRPVLVERPLYYHPA